MDCLIWFNRFVDSGCISDWINDFKGGYIKEVGNHVDLEWVQLLLSPFAWSVVFLAIISVLYISSGFLTFYANKANDKPAYDLMRRWHIFWGPPMMIISLFVFLSLRVQNSYHFNNAVFNYWWMFVISFIFFLIAGALTIFKKNHGLAFIMVILQMLFAFSDMVSVNCHIYYNHL